MEQDVYVKHRKLADLPPVQLLYIIYRRLVEHGLHTTHLWLKDKVVRRIQGFSPPEVSEIQRGLYVGGQHKLKGLAAMRALGITTIVNLREEADDVERGIAMDHYLWLPTTDDTPPTLEDLKRGASFIAERVTAGQGVYIHCAAGVGRAPTMAAAYLVSIGMSPQQAWDAVRRTRPFIRPTPPQINVVHDFAQAQHEGQ